MSRLEARGRSYIEDVSVRGDSLTGFDIEGAVAGDPADGLPVVVEVAGSRVELPIAGGRFGGRLELTKPRLWSPDDPHLYAIELTIGDGEAADRLSVTGGLRRIETRGEALYLNGERFYLRGVLDQGYWPRTGLTAPDADTLIRDIELARELGFNLVRKHLKFEEPLWLDHADRTGMLVWAEPPCPSRFSPEAAEAFEAQLPELVARDGNHPSIIVWGLYNEEWGLDWDIPGSPERAAAAVHAYETMRALDDTRPIVENSGWAHVRSDLVDWHYYDENPTNWARNLAELAAGSARRSRSGSDPTSSSTSPSTARRTSHATGSPSSTANTAPASPASSARGTSVGRPRRSAATTASPDSSTTELTDVEHEMARPARRRPPAQRPRRPRTGRLLRPDGAGRRSGAGPRRRGYPGTPGAADSLGPRLASGFRRSRRCGERRLGRCGVDAPDERGSRRPPRPSPLSRTA
ncbi:glycoside hydrolase family 2 TIM barrel-domain containing protein [Leifsonia sp. L25]|uniref:glycoside hydrolase family 2 TIM barrel-domain containing protein n=1 Tax=Leifsonia sp. L25 TaxID=3423957 RepID=UPI003D68C53A